MLKLVVLHHIARTTGWLLDVFACPFIPLGLKDNESIQTLRGSLESQCICHHRRDWLNYIKSCGAIHRAMDIREKKNGKTVQVEMWYLHRVPLSNMKSRNGITTLKYYFVPTKWDCSWLLTSYTFQLFPKLLLTLQWLAFMLKTFM